MHMENKLSDIKDLLPPGWDIRKDLHTIYIGMLILLLGFGYGVVSLYIEVHERMDTGFTIEAISSFDAPTFTDVAVASYIATCIYIILCIVLAVEHYFSYYKESKSIYIMKRVRSGLEIHRRCLTIPIISLMLGILVSTVLVLLLRMFYTSIIE